MHQNLQKDLKQGEDYFQYLEAFCQNGEVIRQATLDEDYSGIDYFVTVKGVEKGIGYRIMYSWVESFLYDFGIRYTRKSGNRVEYHNVIEGNNCDLYFYGFASKTHKGVLDYWFLLDMNNFRKQVRMGHVRSNIRNSDVAGDKVIFYKLNSLHAEPPVVLNSNYEIPTTSLRIVF